jgi:carbon storage regulator
MLVLSRKPGEKVVIGNDITVTVVAVLGNRIKLGISAPDDVRVLRGELAVWLETPDQAGDVRKPDPQRRPAWADPGTSPDVVAMRR